MDNAINTNRRPLQIIVFQNQFYLLQQKLKSEFLNQDFFYFVSKFYKNITECITIYNRKLRVMQNIIILTSIGILLLLIAYKYRVNDKEKTLQNDNITIEEENI